MSLGVTVVMASACTTADQPDETKPASSVTSPATTAASAGPQAPPSQEPVWTEGRYFPEFPAAAEPFYSIRVVTPNTEVWGSHTEERWRISDSRDAMTALTLVGMQGLINRTGPRVYLDWEGDEIIPDVAHFWRELIGEHIALSEIDLDGDTAVEFLLEQFEPWFQGAVVYDPEIPDTINVATMIAGLEDRVMLAPQQLATPYAAAFSDVFDLRPIAQQHDWDNTEAGTLRLYEWVYKNLWNPPTGPQLERRGIGVISPGPPTSGWCTDDGPLYCPLALPSRDYLVALRLPALWLQPIDSPHAELFDRFLSEAPEPIPVFGFYQLFEDGTVEAASQHGDWVPVITNGNAAYSSANLTVFGGIRPDVIPYEAELNEDRMLRTLGDEPVVTFFSSDGDSVQILMERSAWSDVQGHRLGTTTNPTLAELAPLVWNYYMESASDTTFVSGVSGAGYVFPEMLSPDQLDAYLEHSASYFEDTGLRTVQIFERGNGFDERLARAYYEGLTDAGLLGVFAGHRASYSLLGFEYPGVPLPTSRPTYDLTFVAENDPIDWIVDDVFARTGGEIFLDMVTYPNSQGTVVDDPLADGGSAVLLTPGVLPLGPYATLPPGDYEVTYRMRIPDNSSPDLVAELFVVFVDPQTTDWIPLGGISVHGTDFLAANVYQDFTVTFTLDRSTRLVEILADGFDNPRGPLASPVIDYILARRAGDVDLPVFSTVFVGIGTLLGRPEVLELADQIQQRGGVLLTPDEYFAVLNPAFMIDWAGSLIGTDHPSVVEAKQLFDQQAFLESLLTIREGLKAAMAAGDL